MNIMGMSSDLNPVQPVPSIGSLRLGREDWKSGESREGLTSVPEQGASPDFTVALSREAERLAPANREPGNDRPASGEVRDRLRNEHAETVTYDKNAKIVSDPAISTQAGVLGVMSGAVGERGTGSPSAPPSPRAFFLEPGEKNVSISGKPEGGAESRTTERVFMGGLEGSALGADVRLESEPGPRDRPSGGDAQGRGSGAARALTEGEKREIEELKKRDREVRDHEQAHMGAGAGVASGGARYDTVTGPDGRNYAVGGEVPISIREGSTPEATISNARKVQASAMAPSEPSAQDRMVAAKAAQMEAAARQEKALEQGRLNEFAGPGLPKQDDTVPSRLERLRERAFKAYERVSGAMLPVPVDSGIAVSA